MTLGDFAGADDADPERRFHEAEYNSPVPLLERVDIARGAEYAFLMRLPVPSLLAASLVLANAPAAADGARAARLEVGAPLWSAPIDGLDLSTAPEDLFDLAPGAESLVYLQGAPWPRVMVQELAPGPEAPPRPLSAAVPLSGRPVRFAPDGDAVYFSLLERTETLDGAAPRPRRSFAARAAFPGGELEVIYPPRAHPGAGHAVFLDVRPDGQAILVGLGTGGGPVETGELEVAEIRRLPREAPERGSEAAAGARAWGDPFRLGFAIGARGTARYADGGRAVDCARGETPERETSRLERLVIAAEVPGAARGAGAAPASGNEGRGASSRLEAAPRPAGELDVRRLLRSRLGAGDGFPEVRAGPAGTVAGPAGTLSDGAGAARSGALLSFAPEVLAHAPAAPQPLVFRKGRVLLQAMGRAGRLTLVAPWAWAPPGSAPGPEAGAEAGASAAPEAAAGVAAAGVAGTVRARASAEARPLLEAIARSLEGGAGTPPAALAATILELSPAAGSGADARPAEVRARLEVAERALGPLRLERHPEPPPAPAAPLARAGAEPPAVADAAAGEAAPPRPAVTVIASDGTERWIREDGREAPLPAARFAREAVSLFRLFLDPAGLGDAAVRFGRVAASPPAAGRGELRTIAFSYEDGYAGELVVEVDGDRVLPASVRSPFGSVSYGDWRPWRGRLVPHHARLDHAGEAPRILELLRLESAELPDRLFR